MKKERQTRRRFRRAEFVYSSSPSDILDHNILWEYDFLYSTFEYSPEELFHCMYKRDAKVERRLNLVQGIINDYYDRLRCVYVCDEIGEEYVDDNPMYSKEQFTKGLHCCEVLLDSTIQNGRVCNIIYFWLIVSLMQKLGLLMNGWCALKDMPMQIQQMCHRGLLNYFC